MILTARRNLAARGQTQFLTSHRGYQVAKIVVDIAPLFG
jgi:hypothetical protein